jgi:glucose-6-phosphate isomerase
MAYFTPFTAQMDFQTGVFHPVKRVIQRKLSDIKQIFQDEGACETILDEEGDRLIYEVYVADVPESEGHIPYGTTIIYPGVVGEEFHMTKGHFHQQRDRAEIYLGLSGVGLMLMQTDDGDIQSVQIHPGTIAYVPPFWAHRTINTGDDPFIFFAAWPGDAGHDYKTIEIQGFAKICVQSEGQAELITNSNFETKA